jgi:hypothetical protein
MKGRAPAVFSKKKNREERERERHITHPDKNPLLLSLLWTR